MCVKPGKVGRLSYSLLHSARACAITDRVNNGEGLGIGKRNVAKKKQKRAWVYTWNVHLQTACHTDNYREILSTCGSTHLSRRHSRRMKN